MLASTAQQADRMSTTKIEDALAPPKSRGHLLGGLLLLLLAHLLAFALLPPEWQTGWAVYLAAVQIVYVFPLSWFVSRMGWGATWIGLWLGFLITLLLPVVLWVGGWLAEGGTLGFAGF